jgi:hypothetical protein
MMSSPNRVILAIRALLDLSLMLASELVPHRSDEVDALS